jgi:hypothetical protein
MSTYHYCAFNFVSILLVVFALCLPNQKRLFSLAIGGYFLLVFAAQIFGTFFGGRFWSEENACEITNVDERKRRETLFDWIGLTHAPWTEFFVGFFGSLVFEVRNRLENSSYKKGFWG